MTATLKPATTAHGAALALIHQAAFPPDEAWNANVIALHLGLPGGFGFIDTGGGMILARITMDESEILTLGVIPDARRLGLGTRLLHAVMAHAASLDARSMFLEVSETNAPAQALYASLGFTEVGRRRRYYANGDDAMVMRAALTVPGATQAR